MYCVCSHGGTVLPVISKSSSALVPAAAALPPPRRLGERGEVELELEPRPGELLLLASPASRLVLAVSGERLPLRDAALSLAAAAKSAGVGMSSIAQLCVGCKAW